MSWLLYMRNQAETDIGRWRVLGHTVLVQKTIIQRDPTGRRCRQIHEYLGLRQIYHSEGWMGVLEICLKLQTFSLGHWGGHSNSIQNRSFSLSGLFWLNLKFNPKYTTVRDEGGVLEFLKFQTYSFGHSGGHAKFGNRSFTLSRILNLFLW